MNTKEPAQLTVAIPTYNRNEILQRNLSYLLPQLNERCQLLILDNSSPRPVEQTLQPLLEQYPHIQYQIIRNTLNIGANANILRCLELCQTQWIWMLGDDDRPVSDAIERIFRVADAHPDSLYLNFGYDGLRPTTYFTRGLEQFAARLDPSANVPWISSAVFNAPAMQPNLKLGYQYAYSMLPHVAILLMSLGKSGLSCMCKEQIIDLTQLEEVPFDSQWSRLDLALGFPVLFDLPLKSRVRKNLSRKLLLTHNGESVNLRVLIFQLLLMSLRGKDRKTTYYLYDQIRFRSYYFENRLQRRAALLLGWWILRFPRLSAFAYNLIKKKDFAKGNLQDRYERI